jgi:hypothetical protein
MGQLRLNKFFDTPKWAPSGTSFLDLPPKIRYRIYDEALLAIDRTINLSYRGRQERKLEPPDVSDSPESDESQGCGPNPEEEYWGGSFITYNLLQVSRAIYHEIITIIYSSNTFMIRRRDLGSLQPLQNLSPDCLASLTHLIVRLSVTSCDFGQECRKSGRNQPLCNLLRRNDKPLGRISHADKAVILDWQRTAARLASHIQPHRLSIQFICDTQDYETAKQIVAPFWQLPRLKACAIRLGQQRDPALRQLAEEAALYSTSGFQSAHSSSPFRFTALPEELQTRILRFTDLIAPSEIEWQPGRGFQVRRRPRGCIKWWTGCLCRRYHAAFSPTCKCWEPPSALFLVSHAMRRCALEIFYSRNQFVLDPQEGRRTPVHSTPERVEASLFLRDLMPVSAIHHLRSLEIVFPPFEGDYLPSDSAGYRDWITTISYLAEHANLPQLTLKVLMSDVYGGYHLPYRRGLTRAQKVTVLRMYACVLQPLASLKRPKDLFIDLIYPVDRYERPVSKEQQKLRGNEIINMERRLEEEIMGEGYDSVARGKHAMGTWRTSENERYWGSDDDGDDWDFAESF